MRVSHLMLYEMIGATHHISDRLNNAIWLFERDYPNVKFDKKYYYKECDDIHETARILTMFASYPSELFVEFVRYAETVAKTCRARIDYNHGSIYDKELDTFEKLVKILVRFASKELVWVTAKQAKKTEKNRKKKEKRRARSRSVEGNHFDELVLKLVDAGKSRGVGDDIIVNY